ncbi:hypothetical protein Tco_0562658 [Tanacetum coccineum]
MHMCRGSKNVNILNNVKIPTHYLGGEVLCASLRAALSAYVALSIFMDIIYMLALPFAYIVAFDHLRDALSVIFGLSVTQDTVMSDSEDSTVTYTAVSSPFEDGSDIGSPGVDGPPIMPEDPYA